VEILINRGSRNGSTALCDTDFHESCDAADIIGALEHIFGAPARCARHSWPAS
jgi:hypothetical protein